MSAIIYNSRRHVALLQRIWTLVYYEVVVHSSDSSDVACGYKSAIACQLYCQLHPPPLCYCICLSPFSKSPLLRETNNLHAENGEF